MAVKKNNLNNKKKTVLLVEDESEIRVQLRDKLCEYDYEVIESVDGKEGFEAITKSLPDVIVLDLVMPQMDGMSMIRKCREQYSDIDDRVIIYTQLLESQTVRQVLHRSSAYLPKSEYTIEDVVQHINNHFT